MMHVRACALAALVVLAAATVCGAQVGAAPGPHDCARWPGTAFDDASGTCLCQQGMWWNMRGDACLPREHAAAEFCAAVWPGSQPLQLAFGYRCICPPPLVWDDDAGACLGNTVSGEEDCSRQWPGTMPVLSPSGKEFECRCPGGKRWDETNRTCVDGAPVVVVAPGFFSAPPVPGPGAAIPPSGAPPGYVAPPPGYGAPPPAGFAPGAPPAGYAPVPPPGATVPEAPAQPVPEEGNVPLPRSGNAPAAPPPAEAPVPRVSKPAGTASCDAMLAQIRSFADQGQASQADALGMKAAVSGCDPKAISEAARVKKPAPKH